MRILITVLAIIISFYATCRDFDSNSYQEISWDNADSILLSDVDFAKDHDGTIIDVHDGKIDLENNLSIESFFVRKNSLFFSSGRIIEGGDGGGGIH